MARPRKFDEHAVLLTARQQFWRDGYDGTSMSELCEATGVASQSLYGAFGSKHELFVRTLGDYCAEQTAGLDATRAAAASPWRWLLDAVSFDDGGRLGLGDDGCYLSGSTVALARRDPEVETASQSTYAHIRHVFAAAAADAQRQGEVRADVEPDHLALTFIAAMQGLEFLRKSGMDEASFALAKSSVIDGLTRAYAASPTR